MIGEDIVVALRKRAEIRRKATCRGHGDRLALQLDEAADEIQRLRDELQGRTRKDAVDF